MTVDASQPCVNAAGMVRVGTVALDGTKVAANAAQKANPTQQKLEGEVAEILRQAAEAGQREDREHGDARGDELPKALASKAGRLARLRVAKARLEAEAAERERRYRQRVAALAAAARAKQRGDLLGLQLDGLTAGEALALERPSDDLPARQLGDRLQGQLARAYRRWRHPSSGRRAGNRFL